MQDNINDKIKGILEPLSKLLINNNLNYIYETIKESDIENESPEANAVIHSVILTVFVNSMAHMLSAYTKKDDEEFFCKLAKIIGEINSNLVAVVFRDSIAELKFKDFMREVIELSKDKKNFH